MDIFKTVKGWLLIVSGFSFENRNQVLENFLECIQEFGLDGKLTIHFQGEVKGDYYGGPFDTITLLLHSHSWVTKKFVKGIQADWRARSANK
jgi:hypothetical protein